MVAARLILASTSWAGRRATVAFLAFEQALLDVANWYGKEKDSRFSLAPPPPVTEVAAGGATQAAGRLRKRAARRPR